VCGEVWPRSNSEGGNNEATRHGCVIAAGVYRSNGLTVEPHASAAVPAA